MCTYAIATIDDPPINKTVCRSSDVTIDCGYNWFVLPVTWIINGTSFTQSAIMNNPSYQQNNLNRSSSYSLNVHSINDTTTFQCIVHSDPDVTCTQGIVTVIGMCGTICSVHALTNNVYIDGHIA